MVKVQIDSRGKVYTSNGKALLVQEGSGTPTIESLNITPTTSSQTIIAQTGIDGYSPITVSAVTSSIDTNIQAENIKKNVQILGVTGTLETGITPSGTLNITQNGTYNVTNYANANVNVSGSGSDSKYGATVSTFLGDIDEDGILYDASELTDLTFIGVKAIEAVLSHKFSYTKVRSVSFPDLISLDDDYCAWAFDSCSALQSVSFSSLVRIDMYGGDNMFSRCKSLNSVSFPNLTTINSYGMSEMFSICSALQTISFPSLTTFGNNALSRTFDSCSALENIYFNSLTTQSFGSYKNQFDNMMYLTGKKVIHTLHFPSNLESTISGLSGYPLFGGSSGKVVLAYDLPATS